MSVKTMGAVWELDLSAPKQLVLLALADHADHDGNNIKPGVPLIAWKTGYSERQVQRIMRELEATGLLVRVAVRQGKPTVYRLDLSRGDKKSPYVPREMRVTRDNMTPVKMSSVTSHGKQTITGGDMPRREMTRIHHKDEPSIDTTMNGDTVAKVKKPRPRNVLFDAVATHIFALDPMTLDKTSGGRIAKIVAWLKQNATDATPEQVQAFAKHHGQYTPRDVTKFGETWLRWRANGETNRDPRAITQGTATNPLAGMKVLN